MSMSSKSNQKRWFMTKLVDKITIFKSSRFSRLRFAIVTTNFSGTKPDMF